MKIPKEARSPFQRKQVIQFICDASKELAYHDPRLPEGDEREVIGATVLAISLFDKYFVKRLRDLPECDSLSEVLVSSELLADPEGVLEEVEALEPFMARIEALSLAFVLIAHKRLVSRQSMATVEDVADLLHNNGVRLKYHDIR